MFLNVILVKKLSWIEMNLEVAHQASRIVFPPQFILLGIGYYDENSSQSSMATLADLAAAKIPSPSCNTRRFQHLFTDNSTKEEVSSI